MKSIQVQKPAKSGKNEPTAKQLRDHAKLVKGAREFVFSSIDEPLAVAVRVEGDSMAPAFQHGDRVVIVPSKKMPENGSAVLCTLKDGRLFLRWFYRSPGKRVRLEADNPNYPPMEFESNEMGGISDVVEFVRVVRNRHADAPEHLRKIIIGTAN